MIKALTILLITTLTAISTNANCTDDYKKNKRRALLRPIPFMSSSTGQVGIGSISSTGGITLGTVLLNSDYSTAGVLYGAAFAFEGQYSLEEAWNQIKFYRGRNRMYNVLEEAQIGFGESLEEFYDSLTYELETDNIPSLEEVIELIIEADTEGILCEDPRELYTDTNLKNYFKLILEN
tara:strand:+ start:64996 stop:65532 length:537 start_codon:yes stop_codon:yes gene_type:complete